MKQKILPEDTTIILTNIVMQFFSKLTENNKKTLIRIPGFKGDSEISIKPSFNLPSKLEKHENKCIYLTCQFEFSHLGLGNHPANNRIVTFFISLKNKQIYLANSNGYGSFEQKMKLENSDKHFILKTLES